MIQTYSNDKNSDGEPEPPVATNSSKLEKKQFSNKNSSSVDETENLDISYILSELKEKRNTKPESKINAILTRNQARKQNTKIYCMNSHNIKLFKTQMKKKTKKATTNLLKRKENEKLSKIKLYQCLHLEERGRPRKYIKTLIKNKNKRQRKEQKKKENDNLNEGENKIDSVYEFNQNPLINENADLDYSSDESDNLLEKNSLQLKNQLLETTKKENHEDFNGNLYAETQTIGSEDL